MMVWMEIETSSMCNRTCAHCMRNNHPNRALVQPWFERHLMPWEMVDEAMRQAAGVGVSRICFNHYNEPLMDERIVDIIQLARSHNKDTFLYFCTNGDYLTESIAKGLDGKLNRIIVSLYQAEPVMSEVRRKVKSMFHKTHVYIKGFAHPTGISTTHWGPQSGEKKELYKDTPCTQWNRRLSIGFMGDYLMCCEDIQGVFEFGKFPEVSLKEYWYGPKRSGVIKTLGQPGGRSKYEYCYNCPR
jgi:hypothetical protein